MRRNTLLGLLILSASFSQSALAEPQIFKGTPAELVKEGAVAAPEIQKVVPAGALPGRKIPFYIRADEGERYLVGGTIVNFITRSQDSGGMYELATITGGVGAGEPMQSHAKHHVALYLQEGQADLWINKDHYLMNTGDFANIPEKQNYAFRFRSHRSKLLAWFSGPGILPMYQSLGERTELALQPEPAEVKLASEKLILAAKSSDVTFAKVAFPAGSAKLITNAKLPGGVVPYVIAAYEGEKYAGGSETFALLARQENTNGKFIVVMSIGKVAPMIPRHYHNLHSETFYCLEGHVDMVVNNTKLTLYPGDYAAVPAQTIHAYKMDAPVTRFMGFLTPGLFQNFFTLLGDPGYVGYMNPSKPGALRFDRVLKNMDSLDLHLVDGPKPPEGK